MENDRFSFAIDHFGRRVEMNVDFLLAIEFIGAQLKIRRVEVAL